MINFKKIALLFCLIVPVFVIAQNPTSNCTNAITLSSQVRNFKVSNYPSNTFVGMSFTSKSQVKNLFPEELMASILSANTQEWVNFNEIIPSVISREKNNQINKADRKKNYFELLQKIEFDANGTTYVLIKFKLTVENSPKPMYMTETRYSGSKWAMFSGLKWARDSG
jgi:hypothetical protein